MVNHHPTYSYLLLFFVVVMAYTTEARRLLESPMPLAKPEITEQPKPVIPEFPKAEIPESPTLSKPEFPQLPKPELPELEMPVLPTLPQLPNFPELPKSPWHPHYKHLCCSQIWDWLLFCQCILTSTLEPSPCYKANNYFRVAFILIFVVNSNQLWSSGRLFIFNAQ